MSRTYSRLVRRTPCRTSGAASRKYCSQHTTTRPWQQHDVTRRATCRNDPSRNWTHCVLSNLPERTEDACRGTSAFAKMKPPSKCVSTIYESLFRRLLPVKVNPACTEGIVPTALSPPRIGCTRGRKVRHCWLRGNVTLLRPPSRVTCVAVDGAHRIGRPSSSVPFIAAQRRHSRRQQR